MLEKNNLSLLGLTIIKKGITKGILTYGFLEFTSGILRFRFLNNNCEDKGAEPIK